MGDILFDWSRNVAWWCVILVLFLATLRYTTRRRERIESELTAERIRDSQTRELLQAQRLFRGVQDITIEYRDPEEAICEIAALFLTFSGGRAAVIRLDRDGDGDIVRRCVPESATPADTAEPDDPTTAVTFPVPEALAASGSIRLFSERPVVGEIDTILREAMQVVGRTADSIATRRALMASEARFSAYMNSTDAPAFIQDADGRYVYVNPAFERLYGVSAANCIGTHHPVIAEEIDATGTRRVVVDQGGRRVSLEMYRFQYRGESGIQMYGGIGVDVTRILEYQEQLQRSVDERERLVREMHHRIKNNLTVIQSLIGLEEVRAENPETIETIRRIQGRVEAIVVLHRLLHRRGALKSTSLRAYCKELVESLTRAFSGDGRKTRIASDVAEMELPAGHINSIGLIIQEVLTNSDKYGHDGKNALNATIRGRFDGDEYRMEIRDTGPGFPNGSFEARTPGSGQTIIEALAADIDGSATSENDGGAVVSITFPLPDAVPQ